MPKVDLRTLKREDLCPYCGGDEMWFNSETQLLECDWCGKSPTDDHDMTYIQNETRIIKKMKKYE